MWDDVTEAIASCSEGCYVKVQGDISKYQGKFQITLKKLRTGGGVGDRSEGLSAFDEVRCGSRCGRSCVGMSEAFKDADLRRLVFAFLDDEQIGPAFKAAPAAKRLHHAWLGGLLEHVLTLVRVCRSDGSFLS